MGDYDLTGLDPRKFEHLIQALALDVIGANIIPFGDGPDGGREATFKGPMNYPSLAQSWDGYLVIQCKFQQKPGSTRDQGRWAIEQLESDLKKFLDAKRKLPRPDYYLFVTNVVLTPVPDIGSKDKVLALLDSYRDKLGLKDYAVWDYDKLCRLLDANPNVRQTYAGSITPGDILSMLMDRLPSLRKDFWYLMQLFLQREFTNDLYARLEQFSDNADRPVSLANVFVDLPAFEQYNPEPPDESNLKRLPPGIIAELLQAGADTLKISGRPIPIGLPTLPSGSSGAPDPGRFVIVGGPGQGKSTVGQFLCQLYRAAILRDLPAHLLEQDTLKGITKLARECAEAGIALPARLRFPVRIVLDRFANALAENKCTSLLGYIASRISDKECTVNDLREWLKGHAWVLVLDGLDEVPPTSNRKQVLDEVLEFWREARALEADILVVATTRPQSYNGEFAQTLYEHRYLAPLSPERALSYAGRLMEARYTDVEQKERVLERLNHACRQDTTARLMRTPLQVTIMAALVERMGQAPQDRWSLFDKYYEMFYLRECEKGTPTSVTLRGRKQNVDVIHHRVGLLLQTESERPGATESRLPKARFEQVVRAHLVEEGHKGSELDRRTHEIIDAAVTRLVFLVNVEDSFGFEIRSLQEFMAAEELMDGKDDVIQERLSAIASSIHWRNVFVFAAGHCFSKRLALRDTVCSLCEHLNEHNNDKLAGAVLAGSRLAREILLEGIGRQQPKYGHFLMRTAAKLMSVPVGEENSRLAAAYDQTLDPIFQEEISERLAQPNLAARLGGWTVLQALLDRGIPWATQLANNYWPSDITSQIEILAENAGSVMSSWTVKAMMEVIPQTPPEKLLSIASSSDVLVDSADSAPPWLLAAIDFPRSYHNYIYVSFKVKRGSEPSVWTMRSIEDFTDFVNIKDMPVMAPDWLPVIAAARFLDDPSPACLANLLRDFSQVEKYSALVYSTLPWQVAASIPWPLAACLDACTTREECVALAERVEHGELGQKADWQDAEMRWRENGFAQKDWKYSAAQVIPFDKNIGSIGFPMAACLWTTTIEAATWQAMYSWFKGLKGQRERSRAAIMLMNGLEYLGSRGDKVALTSVQLQGLIKADPRADLSFGIIQGARIGMLDEAWIKTFELLAEVKSLSCIFNPKFGLEHSGMAKTLAEAFAKNPKRINLLGSLGVLAIEGAHFKLSPTVLQEANVETNDDRMAQLYVRLAQGAWDEDAEVQRLLQRFTSTTSRGEIGLCLQTLTNCSQNEGLRHDEAERLVLALHRHLKALGSAETRQTFAFLSEAVARRPSPLQQRQAWDRLKLPGLGTMEFPSSLSPSYTT